MNIKILVPHSNTACYPSSLGIIMRWVVDVALTQWRAISCPDVVWYLLVPHDYIVLTHSLLCETLPLYRQQVLQVFRLKLSILVLVQAVENLLDSGDVILANAA